MIKTNCKGCVFAQIQDHKQIGCQLDRMEKLGINTDDDATEIYEGVEYQSVTRFCTCFRPIKWAEHLSLEESLDAKATVMEEVRPRVGFLIYLDTSRQDAMMHLQTTIDGIKNQSESCARYVVVATEKVEYNEEIHSLLLDQFDQKETEIYVLQLLYTPKDKNFVIDEAFRFALNGWLYFTTSGEPVDKNLLKDLHEHINIKIEKLSIVLPYDDLNGLLFQTALFKYLNGNRKKIWDIDNIDDRMFLEKAKDLDVDGDCILTWREVNAS